MADFLLQFLLLFSTYFLSGLALSLAWIRLGGLRDRESVYSCVWFFLGLGPFTISWLLNFLMVVLPAQSHTFYITLCLLPVFLLLLVFGKEIPFLFSGLACLWTDLRRVLRYSVPDKIALLSLLAVSGMLLLATLFFPMTGNDPLEYAQTARIIFEKMQLSIYPVLDTSVSSGYYGPWSHPPGYILLMVWGYLVQGTAEYSGTIKVIAPFYTFCSVVLLLNLTKGLPLFLRIIGIHIFLSIPMYFAQASVCHIDPIRIHGFVLAIVAFWKYVEHQNWRSLILLSYCVGFAVYTHSVGILIAPLLGGIVLLGPLMGLPKKSATFGLLALLIGFSLAVPQYIKNYNVFGSVIADSSAVPAYDLPNLKYSEHFRTVRGISGGLEARLVNGAFKVFTKINSFGYSYWFFVLAVFLGLVLLALKKRVMELVNTSLGRLGFISLLVVVAYLFGAILSVLIGLDTLIKNDRYMMTQQPFVALSFIIFAAYFLRSIQPVIRPWILTVLVVVALVPLVNYPISRLMNLGRAFQLTPYSVFENDIEKLNSFRSGIYKSVFYVRNHTPKDSVILNFRQSDFSFYGNRTFVSHLDPKVLNLLSIDDVKRALVEIERLGITHIASTGYSEPAMYNSIISDIVGSPNLAELVFEEGGYRVFRIRTSTDPVKQEEFFTWDSVSISDLVWTEYSSNKHYQESGETYGDREFRRLGTGVSKANSVKFKYSGKGLITQSPVSAFESQFDIPGGENFSGQLKISGKGLVRFYVIEYSGANFGRYNLIWEGVLDSVRDVKFQFMTLPETTHFRVAVAAVGMANTELQSVKINRSFQKARTQKNLISTAQKNGWLMLSRWRKPDDLLWGMDNGYLFYKAHRKGANKLVGPVVDLDLQTNYRVSGMVRGTGILKVGLHDSAQKKTSYFADFFLDDKNGMFEFKTISKIGKMIAEEELDLEKVNLNRLALTVVNDPIRKGIPQLFLDRIKIEKENENGTYATVYDHDF